MENKCCSKCVGFHGKIYSDSGLIENSKEFLRVHDYRISMPCSNMPFNFFFPILSPSQFFSSSFLCIVSLWQFCPRRKIQDDFSARKSDLENVDKTRHATSFETPRIHKYGVQSCFVNSPLMNRQGRSQQIYSVECTSVFKNKNCFTERRLLCNRIVLFPFTHWCSPEGRQTEWHQTLIVFGPQVNWAQTKADLRQI